VQGPGRTELSRDFTYVDDIVDGVLAALGEIKPSGKHTAEYKVWTVSVAMGGGAVLCLLPP